MTPAQMAAPVQLEALPVAVRRAVGESVTRQEIWSPRAAPGQSLRLIQLLTLRTLLCSRGGHANISRIERNENLRAASVGGKLQHRTEPLVYGPRRPWKRFGWKAKGNDDESGAAHANGENVSRKK